MKPITVLFFGGGQDSTALLYLYVYDADFRRRYVGDSHFVVIMADTGNEFEKTYLHVAEISRFCALHGVEFHFLHQGSKYHGKTWPSLQGQFELNDNIMSVALPKSCTDNLKIKPCYAFLESLIIEKYGFEGRNKKVYYRYFEQFGKLKTMIGFAKGEESRCTSPQTELFPEIVKDPRPVYRRKTVEHIYPLIDLRLDRAGCQRLIESYGHSVPIPSNCMMCPYQSAQEIVYLERFYPDIWAVWVEREAAKLAKNVTKTRNLGVKGEITLEMFLKNAKLRFGHWTDEQLITYRNSHGHCVKSRY